MRPAHIGGASVLVLAAALTGASAQSGPDRLTPAQIALACASHAVNPATAAAIRVLGAQDPLPRTMLSPQELLVVGGGTAAGLQLGQQYFIRGIAGSYVSGPAGRYDSRTARSSTNATTTAGWLRIVALNETTSIARIEYACGAIFVGDYLEPFSPPAVPADADRDDSTGELDFSALARVVAAPANHLSAAPGEFIVIDRGEDQSVAPGARMAIYRDVRVAAMPLMAIGEAVVMSTASDTALARINRARDAVFIGDYLVPRK